MRTFNKIDHQHYVGIEVIVNGKSVGQNNFPTPTAFKLNHITDMEIMLKAIGQSPLTVEETQQLVDWANTIIID